MSYREQRDYENLQRCCFVGEGEYGIPILAPAQECEVENWIGFNYARTCEEPEAHGIHFFVDDYQFVRLWRQPDSYLRMLGKFQAVCTPEFSLYADFPKALQIYNHYRKHWMGAYWQMHGISVIPTVTWNDPDTWEWCFDGEPRCSVIAVSSVGLLSSQEYKGWLLGGYEAMMDKLDPIKIIWKGSIPDDLERGRDRIIQIPSFTDKWRQKQLI